MNLNTLRAFRHEAYACFTRAKDALFNTVDALLTEPTAQSFAELSLSPCFERRWPSLYEAFEDGGIDRGHLQQVFVDHLPLLQLAAGQRLLWAIDASGIARPQAKTSPDRTALHVPNLPESRTPPITAGWQFSTLVVVPQAPSSWGYMLDSRRIPSWQPAGQVASEQLHEVVARLPEGLRPLLVADRYSPSAAFLRATGPLPLDKLLRCKKNRVFYRAAPASTGKRGAPRKDGERFACHDESTHGPPDEHWEGSDGSGHPLRVERWNHLHLKEAREVDLSVLRVSRLGADTTETKRKPRVSWFIEQGLQRVSLSAVRPTYQCRYGIEHSYRFEKHQVRMATNRACVPQNSLSAGHRSWRLCRSTWCWLALSSRQCVSPGSTRRGL